MVIETARVRSNMLLPIYPLTMYMTIPDMNNSPGLSMVIAQRLVFECALCVVSVTGQTCTVARPHRTTNDSRKRQDYDYVKGEYPTTLQKIKHILRRGNKVKKDKVLPYSERH